MVLALGFALSFNTTQLPAYVSTVWGGQKPAFFSRGGGKCFARVGARAASVELVLVGAKAWSLLVACGGLGDEFRANFGGDLEESVAVFVGWSILVGGTFLGEACLKLFEE